MPPLCQLLTGPLRPEQSGRSSFSFSTDHILTDLGLNSTRRLLGGRECILDLLGYQEEGMTSEKGMNTLEGDFSLAWLLSL